MKKRENLIIIDFIKTIFTKSDKPIMLRLYNKLKDTQTPRYLVLGIDTLIALISILVITYGRETRIAISQIPSLPIIPLPSTIFMLIIFIVSFMLFKTHLGIVRYGDYKDTINIYKSIISTIIFLVTFEWIISHIEGGRNMLLASSIIITFIGLEVLLGMTLLRLLIKYIYNEGVKSEMTEKIKVVVFGISPNSVSLASYLQNEKDGLYSPIAFLDHSKGIHSSSEILSIPVYRYSQERLISLFKKLDTNTIIVASSEVDSLKTIGVDQLLNEGIKILYMQEGVVELDKNGEKSKNQIKELQIEDLLSRRVIECENEDVKNYLTDKVIVVTGGAGSIGSEIVTQLVNLKAKKVIIFDSAESPLYTIQQKMIKIGGGDIAVAYIGDVRSKKSLTTLFETYKPQVVFHAAAYKHVPMMENYPAEAIAVNVKGSKNLADMAIKYNVERFVMISTDKAVNPTNVMGTSKRIAEIYIQSLATKQLHDKVANPTRFITTRFGNVLGSNGSVVPLFKEQIAAGGPITLTDKRIIRYFMIIPEACELVLEACCMGKGGEIFVFDMGDQVKIYDLAVRMILLSGLKPYEDIDIIETGLRPGEKLYEELLNNKETTISTKNAKIMIGKVREYRYEDVLPQIESLINTDQAETTSIVKKMKALVPEYKSQNSVFEALDKE